MTEHEDRLRQAMTDLEVREFDPEFLDEVIVRSHQGRRQRTLLILAVLAAVTMIAAGIWLPGPRAQNNQSLATPSASGAPSASVTPSAPASTEPAPSPSASGSTGPATTSPDASPSGAAGYHINGPIGPGYYFSSPSGNFYCAMGEDGTVGCQATVPVAGMEQCGSDPKVRAAMVSWRAGDAAARVDCTTQGVFVGQSAAVLPYGESLRMAGNVCESLPTGVSCYPEGTNGGFVIAAEGIRLGPDSPGAEPTTEIIDPAPFQGNGGVGDAGMGPGGYYFVSPSGNFVCGMGASVVGCQATMTSVGTQVCGPSAANVPVVSIVNGGPATTGCTELSDYYAEPHASGADTFYGMPVLPYGKGISVHGALCESSPDGISCTTQDAGFTISSQGITTR